jgi:hypothetical protein
MSRRKHSLHNSGDHAAGHSPAQEIVAQRVRRRGLVDAGALQRLLEDTLEGLVEEVMAPPHDTGGALPRRSGQRTAARILRQCGLGEDPEPGPGLASPRVLSLERKRQAHAGHAGSTVGGP